MRHLYLTTGVSRSALLGLIFHNLGRLAPPDDTYANRLYADRVCVTHCFASAKLTKTKKIKNQNVIKAPKLVLPFRLYMQYNAQQEFASRLSRSALVTIHPYNLLANDGARTDVEEPQPSLRTTISTPNLLSDLSGALVSHPRISFFAQEILDIKDGGGERQVGRHFVFHP